MCQVNLKPAVILLELLSKLTRLFNKSPINKNQPYFIHKQQKFRKCYFKNSKVAVAPGWLSC